MGRRGLALQFHTEVTAPGSERWLMTDVEEIGLTLGMSVMKLPEEPRLYAPRLQVRAASCWQTWLHEGLGA